MHPSKDRLEQFVESGLGLEESRRINEHLAACDFCGEFCDNYRNYLRAVSDVRDEEVDALGGRLMFLALAGEIINFKPLLAETFKTEYVLAADGPGATKEGVIGLATFYSEDPEMVLKLMHDDERHEDYLQLVSDFPELVAGVLVQFPDLDMEYHTDSLGRAELQMSGQQDWAELSPRIVMPDAFFDLSLLAYDPEKVECCEEIVLETDRKDRVRVTFEGKTEGIQITVKVLALGGESDFGPLRVSIGSGLVHCISKAITDGVATFVLDEYNQTLDIRIFQL